MSCAMYINLLGQTPPLLLPCIRRRCYHTSTKLAITCESDPLHGTQSANAPSKKKKDPCRPLQQTGCKAKQDGLCHKQQESRRCMSQTRRVGTIECNTEFICGACQTCICARESQQAQNGRKMIRTWQPSPLKTPVLLQKLAPSLN
jgi:hypothetical protein